ncbi:MAG: hypothetical protein DRR19_19550 [Candidatus Parabeggiatoa sp. nov. 1]|nr:MAG: hypothetical protein DRR19_19550 [Gammaproteobacteria bacterium]
MPIQQVIIRSQARAAKFKAELKDKPIYLIRIFDNPKWLTLTPYAELKYPEHFQIIRSYTFDDIDRPVGNQVLFKDEIAEQIITDFENQGTDCQTLLVHCRAGISRSSAVAIALCEIFHLQTPEQIADMKKRFFAYNHRIYNTLLDVSKKMAVLT